MSRHQFWTSDAGSHSGEERVRGGVFDEAVTDMFIHSIPDGRLKDTMLEAFREVLLPAVDESPGSTTTALAATA
jgi:hypothetical protein